MMTEGEIKEITARVLQQLRKDSVRIEDLKPTNVLAGTDLMELDAGRSVSLEDLRKFIRGFGIYLEILSKNDTGAVPTDNNVFSSLRTLSEIAKSGEEAKHLFLRKDQPDQTNFLVRFGEFVDSMTSGKGTGIFPNGRIQTDRLEVRDSMTVLDLIINEIHSMAGEFNFSDCGKIDRVQLVADNTYRLWMHKDTEFDVTGLEANDVLYSIVNDLRIGGSSYYTSWFRPVDKNPVANTLTVVLYPDSEVPGGRNYPPAAGYNVTRRGNAQLPTEGETNERSQSWMLSSKEGCIMFLSNVYKPILEDYNYALTLGKLPGIKAVDDLGLTGDVGLYAETMVVEKLYQTDWNGDIIPRTVYRGEWSHDVAVSDRPYRFVENEKEYPDGKHYFQVEQHTVHHYGCKWGCIKDRTEQEPVWNSSDWTLLEGDKNYSMSFVSTDGWQFFVSEVDTVVTALVSYANRDITDELMKTAGVDVAWVRDTGNVPLDATWKPKLKEPNRLHLTREDMGIGWGDKYRKVSFTCRMFIPVGGGNKEIVNSINIKI